MRAASAEDRSLAEKIIRSRFWHASRAAGSRPLRIAALGLCLAAAPPACREKADPVRQALDSIVEAAQDRDPDGVLENLSSDFRDANGTGLSEAQSTLRRYFAAYESLQIAIADLSVERAPNAARVTFRADLSGKPRRIGGLEGYLPRSSSYRFDLRLVPEEDRWKVAWASYAPAEDR